MIFMGQEKTWYWRKDWQDVLNHPMDNETRRREDFMKKAIKKIDEEENIVDDDFWKLDVVKENLLDQRNGVFFDLSKGEYVSNVLQHADFTNVLDNCIEGDMGYNGVREYGSSDDPDIKIVTNVDVLFGSFKDIKNPAWYRIIKERYGEKADQCMVVRDKIVAEEIERITKERAEPERERYVSPTELDESIKDIRRNIERSRWGL